MSSLTAIRAMLIADPDVTALVGDRIMPDHFDQDGERPMVCMWNISAVPYDTLEGGLGFERARVRVECVGDSRAQADAIWLAVNKALTKDLKRGTWDGTLVDCVTQGGGAQHLSDRPMDGSENWLYRSIQSFEISYYLYEKE